jgi:hypothetical protein
MRWLTIAGLTLALVSVGGAYADHPLRTGFADPTAFSGPDAAKSVVRARAAGASIVRLLLSWTEVASESPAAPSDPEDPAYSWASFDREVVNAVHGGLIPLVYVAGGPQWARGTAVGLPGTWPAPGKLAQFAAAAAQRYSGRFTPNGDSVALPRVRFWEAWNEPNAGSELAPQRVGGRPVSPAQYRRMVNAFTGRYTARLRAISWSPARSRRSSTTRRTIQVVAPMRFMSDLLQTPHRRTCSQQTHFDIWGNNPYSNGGPDWHASNPLDASIGDLPEVRDLLVAAMRLGTIVSS